MKNRFLSTLAVIAGATLALVGCAGSNAASAPVATASPAPSPSQTASTSDYTPPAEPIGEGLADEVLADGVTDYAGISAEYQRAVDSFPLPLPDGFSFPAEYQGGPPSEPTQYEAGNGYITPYFLAQCAYGSEAINAHEGGDEEAASENLHLVIDVTYTEAFDMFVEGPSRGFVTSVLEPALDGNYGPLTSWSSGNCS